MIREAVSYAVGNGSISIPVPMVRRIYENFAIRC